MAHKEDVYVDPQGRFNIGEHTCVERLTGSDGECVNDWCNERGHKWFQVTKVLPDGFGEVVGESFDTEWETINWAEEYFDEEGNDNGEV